MDLQSAGVIGKVLLDHILLTLVFLILFFIIMYLARKVNKNKRVNGWFKGYMRDEGSNLPFQNPKTKGLFLAVVLGLLGLVLMVVVIIIAVSILFFLRDLKLIQ